jgi:hypothetical protein
MARSTASIRDASSAEIAWENRLFGPCSGDCLACALACGLEAGAGVAACTEDPEAALSLACRSADAAGGRDDGELWLTPASPSRQPADAALRLADEDVAHLRPVLGILRQASPPPLLVQGEVCPRGDRGRAGTAHRQFHAFGVTLPCRLSISLSAPHRVVRDAAARSRGNS